MMTEAKSLQKNPLRYALDQLRYLTSGVPVLVLHKPTRFATRHRDCTSLTAICKHTDALKILDHHSPPTHRSPPAYRISFLYPLTPSCNRIICPSDDPERRDNVDSVPKLPGSCAAPAGWLERHATTFREPEASPRGITTQARSDAQHPRQADCRETGLERRRQWHCQSELCGPKSLRFSRLVLQGMGRSRLRAEPHIFSIVAAGLGPGRKHSLPFSPEQDNELTGASTTR